MLLYGRLCGLLLGYRESDGACSRIAVPVNSHPNESVSGSGRQCNWGYKVEGTGCEAVLVPAPAFVDREGTDWKCERGYAKLDNECASVNVRVHGYLDSAGSGWQCERVFAEDGSDCAIVAVPSNAHLLLGQCMGMR